MTNWLIGQHTFLYMMNNVMSLCNNYVVQSPILNKSIEIFAKIGNFNITSYALSNDSLFVFDTPRQGVNGRHWSKNDYTLFGTNLKRWTSSISRWNVILLLPIDTSAHEILSYLEINDEHIIMQGNWGYPKQHEGEILQDNNQQNSICFQQKSEIIFIFSYQSQSAPSLNFPLKFLSEPLPLIFTKDEVQYVSSERGILNFNYLIECYLPQD